MAHIEANKSCGRVQRGAPFTNVARHCHPCGSCVGPDVDHIISYTYHWLYQRCHEPVGECAECA
jgi:hypothetical protein